MKILIDLDDDILAAAQKELGTTTIDDTVNAALRFVAERPARMQALFEPDPDLDEAGNALLRLGIPPGAAD